MAIQFGCQCGQAMTVRDEFAGKQIRCPKCSVAVVVPGSASSTAPSPPPTSPPPASPSSISPTSAAEGLPPIQPPTAATGFSPSAQSAGHPASGADANAGEGTVDVRHLPPVQAWAYARASDFTLIALTHDALWIGDKNEVDLPNLASYLNGGGDPTPVFAERGIRIDLPILYEAEADKHGSAVDVQYQLGDRRAISHLDFANQSDRNVFFSSLQERLGQAVAMETEQVPAWKAGIKPLAWAGFIALITVLFYLGAKQVAAGEAAGEGGGRKQFLKKIMATLVDLIGPNGVLILGTLLVIGCVIWFVKRAQQPPILVRLKRVNR